MCCVAAGVALLVQFRIKQYMAVDGVLIAIACILTLTLVGNIYTWAQTLMALVSSQKHRVLKAADHVSGPCFRLETLQASYGKAKTKDL